MTDDPRDRWRRLARDRNVCWGDVTIRSRRIAVGVVVERFTAGDTIEDLCAEFDIEPADVFDAIRFVLFISGASLDTDRADKKINRLFPVD